MTTRRDKAIEAYIHLRDTKAEIKKRHSEELAPLNDRMRLIENWFLKTMDAEGITKFGVNGTGTVYQQINTKAKIEDFAVFWKFVLLTEHGDAFLEKRVAKDAVEGYLESTGNLPPGVSMTAEKVVRIRRA